MTHLQRNIRQAQFRIGMNRWMVCLGWCLLIAASMIVIVAVVDKLFAMEWSRIWINISMLAAAVAVSIIWSVVQQAGVLAAAMELDRAADLKERTSSGLACMGMEDPYARAALQDAERYSARISVRSFIRYRWPVSMSWGSLGIAIAMVVWLLPLGPLNMAEEVLADSRQQELVRQEIQRVERKLQPLKEQNALAPKLKGLDTKLETIDNLPLEKLQTAEDVRREAIKNVDSLADQLREERKDARFEQMNDLKKMFRSLNPPKESNSPTDKLSKSLAKGDFQAAQDAIREMQEQLAKMKEQDDPQMMEQLQEKVKQLADQIEQAAQNQKRNEDLQKKLEQSGVDPDTAKRLLENLTKEDLQKALQQMQKEGISQDLQQQLERQLKSNQGACKQCSKLAESLKQAAQAMQGSEGMESAGSQLQEAADMLNAMEQLQQQAGELDSTLQNLQDMKNELASGDPGGEGSEGDSQGEDGTGGDGQGQGQGQGQGTGGQGQGRGGLTEMEQTDVRFVKERTPVHTTEGSIISKMFVEGEQMEGDVRSRAAELEAAAERDATDAINKGNIPKQYHRMLKGYFLPDESKPNETPSEEAQSEESAPQESDG